MGNNQKFSFVLTKNKNEKYDIEENQNIEDIYDLIAVKQYLKEKLEWAEETFENLVRENFFTLEKELDDENEEDDEEE